MTSKTATRKLGTMLSVRKQCCCRASAVLLALFASAQASALSVSAQCAVPGVGGLVGETSMLFASCANETLPSDAWIVVGATQAAASGLDGTMRVRTEQDHTSPGFSVQATASITETIVIDQLWDGLLELTLSVVGSGAPRFLFTNQLNPMTDPAGTSAQVTITLGSDALGGGSYVISHSEADGWEGLAAGATADFDATGSSINGVVSKSFLVPDTAVGLPIELGWAVTFRQWATGYLDGYGTGMLGITLPEGFTYTSSSAEFLSTPVPLPTSLMLLCAGLAGIALRRGRS